ncbi:MAG: hypothetical protein J6B91_08675 [Prevotella sp.]|nr:hypothetical protein [Prevotella sp.]
MRSLIVFFVLFALGAGLADTIMPRLKYIDFADIMEEDINKSKLAIYTNPDIGFTAKYPDCFKISNTEEDTLGSVTFRYDTDTSIVMECFTCRIADTANPDRAIAKIADSMHALITKTDDGYILHGRIYENDVPIDGYRHYTKYSAKDKLWIAYSLIYPEEYSGRLGRLFQIIKEWKPWHNEQLSAA